MSEIQYIDTPPLQITSRLSLWLFTMMRQSGVRGSMLHMVSSPSLLRIVKVQWPFIHWSKLLFSLLVVTIGAYTEMSEVVPHLMLKWASLCPVYFNRAVLLVELCHLGPGDHWWANFHKRHPDIYLEEGRPFGKESCKVLVFRSILSSWRKLWLTIDTLALDTFHKKREWSMRNAREEEIQQLMTLVII